MEKRLNALLYDVDIDEEDLYYMVGYRCIDVNTKEDFNEVVRLLSNNFSGLDKYYYDLD